MALYAFDGTWNEDEESAAEDTNVKKFADAYERSGGHVAYIEGVGTRFGSIGRLLGGIFGAGGKTRIEEMYDRLVAAWEAGERDIDIIGFSRGGALAVHFANVIAKEGVKNKGGETLASPEIRFLGVWDVVASFGIPIDLVLDFQNINIGYDLVAPASVRHCFHAMALNERRQTFEVTRQDRTNDRQNVTELWFRGVHSDVGGGNRNTLLSNISLKWMMENAQTAGLPIQPDDIRRFDKVDSRAPLSTNLDPIENDKRVVFRSDRFHPSAVGKSLEVGESETFTVHAPTLYSWSGVRLEAGGYYSFTIKPDDKWEDGGITCGPEGWESEDLPWYKEGIVTLFEQRRRCPRADWFELIGSIGDSDDILFRIGAGGEDATYRAPAGGELFAFPNDLRSKYGNNVGDMVVTVTRKDGPGPRALRNCADET